MRLSHLPRTAGLALSLAAGAAAAAPDARFSFKGLTPAEAGQTLAQAEAALGQPLRPEAVARPPRATAAAAPPPAACQYRVAERHPGVRFAVSGGVLTRIETRDARYATLSGVHVGDTEAQARRAYGQRLLITPHPYFDKGHMLTVASPDKRFALVMETNDGGHIITLRGGRMPDVGWLEGCS